MEEIKVSETESKATNKILKLLFWARKKGDMNSNNNEKLRIPLTLHVLTYTKLFWFILLKEAVSSDAKDTFRL